MVRQQYLCSLTRGQEGPKTGGSLVRIWRSYFGSCVIAGAAGLALVSGCGRGGDGPPPPGDSLLELVQPTAWDVVPSGPGVAYYSLRNEVEPWAIHLLRIELGRCELGFSVLEAPVDQGADPGRSRVSELAASGNGVVAAVNGDFFTPGGLPVGTEVVMGVPRRIRSRPAFAWHPEATPWMGIPERVGDSVLVLGWAVPQPGGDAGTEVVSGLGISRWPSVRRSLRRGTPGPPLDGTRTGTSSGLWSWTADNRTTRWG